MIKAADGTEIIESNIYTAAEEYVAGMSEEQRSDLPKYWRAVLYAVRDNAVGKADTDDVDGLYKLWDAYKGLCAQYGVLPTIAGFGMMTGHSRDMYGRWGTKYRKDVTTGHSRFYQKALKDCEDAISESLSNDAKTSVNRIFVAKALYGWRETAPVREEALPDRVLTSEQLPRLSSSMGAIESSLPRLDDVEEAEDDYGFVHKGCNPDANTT